MTECLSFICGKDEFLVKDAARKVFEEAAAVTNDPDGVEKLDGSASKVDEVAVAVNRLREAVLTPSLFGGQKVIWWHSVNFLNEGVTGKAKGTAEQIPVVLETLEALLEGRVGNTRLIVSAAPITKRNKVITWAGKQKGIQFQLFEDSGKNAGGELLGLIEEKPTGSGVQFSSGALPLLLERVGGDSRVALAEVDKLITWLGPKGGKVTEKMIFELVPVYGETEFFEVAEVFFSAPLPEVLSAIRRHFFTAKDAGRPLLTVLQNRVTLLLQLRVLQDAGHLSKHGFQPNQLESAALKFKEFFPEGGKKAATNLFSQNAWYLKRLGGLAGKKTLKGWIDTQQLMIAAFESLMDRRYDHEEVFRELAIRCGGNS